MDKSALDGAKFDTDVKATFDRKARQFYEEDVKSRVFLYSYGNTVTHHATVIYFESVNEAVAFHIRGHPDTKKLMYTVKSTKWKPQDEPTFKSDKEMSFRDIFDHGLDISKAFGEYRVGDNDCQDWNNKFLLLFSLKRRQFKDLVSWVGYMGISGALIGIAYGVMHFFTKVPKMLKY
ncbi:hypothetical protein DFJ77DRAFT_467231 [Powellomyces hirtus]|nr:hypothetical protein DFJ77DRAFT_467231 [Powellomyces hirtus]